MRAEIKSPLDTRYLSTGVRVGIVFFLATTLLGCGGGGGGGGGDGRSTRTALRIIHGAVDTAPLDLYVGSTLIQTARYSQSTQYVAPEDIEGFSGFGETESLLSLSKKDTNSSSVFFQIANQLAEETEYTLLVFGSSKDDNSSAILIEEPVTRPEEGFARVQLLHTREGTSALTLKGDDVSLGPVGFGSSSGYITVESGPQSFRVVDRGGRQIAGFEVELEDQGEVTLLVSGSEDLEVTFSQIFTDLD